MNNMRYFTKAIDALQTSLNSELTSTQKLIVWINYNCGENDFDLYSFLEDKKIIPTVLGSRLWTFGHLLEEFWNTLSSEEQKQYQMNSELLYKDCFKWIKKMTLSYELGGRKEA